MNDPCFTTHNEELLLGRLAATRDAADTSSLQQQQEEDDGDSLASLSLSSWLLTCPLSLERMQDPVVVFPSGHSYDRQSICESLLHFPNLDPKSGMYYQEPLRYATNYALRNLLQQDGHEYCVVPYNDAYFAKAYQQAWREKITDKQTTRHDDDNDNQPHHHDPYDRRRRQVPPPIHNTAAALFSSRLRQAAMVVLVVTVISWGVWHKAATERRRQQQRHAHACAQLRTWSPASAWYAC